MACSDERDPAATADRFRLDGALVAEVDPVWPGPTKREEQCSRVGGSAANGAGRGGRDHRIASAVLPIGESRDVAPVGAVDARLYSDGAAFSVVGRDSNRVLGLPMLAGRDFSDAELVPGSSERIAIIDDVLAERLWPGEDALGRLIQFLDGDKSERGQPIRVVGIVPGVKHSLGNPHPSKHVYVPLGQHYESAMTLQIRLADGAAERAMLGTVARVIREVDERVPSFVSRPGGIMSTGSLEAWTYRAGARVFSAFAGSRCSSPSSASTASSRPSCRAGRGVRHRIAIGAQPRALLWRSAARGWPHHGHRDRDRPAVGPWRRADPPELPARVDRFRPVVLVTAPLILLAASLLAS